MTAPRIDTSVHVHPHAADELLPFLPPYWQEWCRNRWFREPVALAATFPPGSWADVRTPGDGDGDPAAARRRAARVLLGDNTPGDDGRSGGADVAILHSYYGIDGIRNPDFTAALYAALNDWLAAEWLHPHPGLRGSIGVLPRLPELAAEEVRRIGDRPEYVQAVLPVRADRPYGNRSYHPLYAELVRHNLPLGLQFGGMPGNAPTATGWPTWYLEQYVVTQHVYQSQVISLIFEGTFDAFPDLRVTLIDSGFTWIPGLLWRMDQKWKGLRRETPWLKEPPSEYFRRHFRVTSLPVDQVVSAQAGRRLRTVWEHLDHPGLVMYGSDFPRDHAGANDVLAAALPADARADFFGGTAAAWYGIDLPQPSAAGAGGGSRGA